MLLCCYRPGQVQSRLATKTAVAGMLWPGLPGPGPRYRGQHSGGHLAAQSGGLTAATRGLLAATGLLLTKSPIPLDMNHRISLG